MKRSIGYLFLVAGLGALIWLGLQNRRLNADLEQARNALHPPAREARSDRRLTPEHSEPVPAGAPVSLPDTTGTAASVLATEAANPWTDPAWSAARFNEAILDVEVKYGRFFRTLKGWSPERLEALKRQLALNEMALLEGSLPRSYPPSEAEKKAMQQAGQATAAKNQQQLREIMGETDYGKLDAMVKTEPYRESVGAITSAMSAKGVDIPSELEDSIRTVYAKAVQDAAAEAAQTDPGPLSEEQRAALKKQQMEAFRTRLFDQMSGVLDDKQLRIFMDTEIERGGGG